MECITSARQAELNAAVRMRLELGFPDAEVTPIGPDGGVDVIARGAVAQVKHESAQTGRPALQRLYGARGSDTGREMLFFSAAGYSRHSIDYADEVGIMLFTYSPLGDLKPENGRAAFRLNSNCGIGPAQQRAPETPRRSTPPPAPLVLPPQPSERPFVINGIAMLVVTIAFVLLLIDGQVIAPLLLILIFIPWSICVAALMIRHRRRVREYNEACSRALAAYGYGL
ncbi:restriction endonuclease [Tsukamurella pseudospumae]|uniref:Restriction endonuclease type IV Mrr domain-containing protein n=1 Tax=Tsukamurella pseudospumae TaxID=239498 RepID=A0A137ZRJ3_9ACTN|nr:restriction endonuclease [Tsukamurella pseudospumae]KXP00786.1 hypothetical protein AXK61_14440 [Tsukamurella pseudospumae]